MTLAPIKLLQLPQDLLNFFELFLQLRFFDHWEFAVDLHVATLAFDEEAAFENH